MCSLVILFFFSQNEVSVIYAQVWLLFTYFPVLHRISWYDKIICIDRPLRLFLIFYVIINNTAMNILLFIYLYTCETVSPGVELQFWNIHFCNNTGIFESLSKHQFILPLVQYELLIHHILSTHGTLKNSHSHRK